MSEYGSQPVRGDEAAIATLYSQVDTLSTEELTALARQLGLQPPQDGPDWYVVLELDPEGNERGLFWDGPEDAPN